MWPWGHLAFGYVLYSIAARSWFDEPPRGPAVYVLVLATQLPDLVDKPLSWSLGVFPAGYSVAHSAFVAVPVGVAVALAARRNGRTAAGVAFVVGYWSHLIGDVLVGAMTRQTAAFGRVLWPVVTMPPYAEQLSALERALTYFTAFVAELRTPDDPWMLLLYFGPFVAAAMIWVVDGMPGLPRIRRRTARTP